MADINSTSQPYSASAASFGAGSAAGGFVSAAADTIASVLNYAMADEQARIQRKWNEKMMNKENEWNLNMWNLTNEYNSPANQVSRMYEAGLNPLYYGLDGSSANSMQSAQALGYQQPSGMSFNNPMDTAMQYAMQKKQLEVANKQIDKLNSDIRHQDESTKGTALDNEFKEATMNARVRSEELKNEISQEEKKNIIQHRDLVAEQIRKTANEADNEFEKKALYQAEARLKNASADEIIELLPYKKLNYEASTMAQRAAASAATWAAMRDKKFVELGGVEAQINETKARIDKLAQEKKTSEAQEQAAKAKAALDEWKHSVQNGTVFNWVFEDENSNAFERELAGFFNGVFNVANMVTTSVGNIFPKL